MKSYQLLTKEEREAERSALLLQYEEENKKGYKLDMSRGKPAPDQLDLSMDMLSQDPKTLIHTRKGTDVRNYGELAGVDEAKELFAEVLGLKMENIIMGGQSSLALMYDCIVRAWIFGSYSRNEQRLWSDIDILVQYDRSRPLGLMKIAGMKVDLEDLLNCEVDLVEEGTLRPWAVESVNRDKKLIYERA